MKKIMARRTMAKKQKFASPKDRWQSIRRRYTWHLRENKFDRTQWWKNLPDRKIKPVAALYELVRRHPLIAEKLFTRVPLPGSPPPIPLPTFLGPKPSLRITCRLAMKSWPKLTEKEKEDWELNIGKVKGFDLRPAKSLCVNVTESAHLAVWQAHDKAAEYLSGTKYPGCGLGWYPRDNEYELAVAEQAIEAYRNGFVILVVAPGLKPKKAKEAVAKLYGEHLKLNPSGSRGHRARYSQWLPLISEFEDAETSAHKAKSQLFAHYRRLIEGIQFA